MRRGEMEFLRSKNSKLKNGRDAVFQPRKGLSGNTGANRGAVCEELERKARFFAVKPQKMRPKYKGVNDEACVTWGFVFFDLCHALYGPVRRGGFNGGFGGNYRVPPA
jgi:hypothetical protein